MLVFRYESELIRLSEEKRIMKGLLFPRFFKYLHIFKSNLFPELLVLGMIG